MRGPGYPTPRRRFQIPEAGWHFLATICFLVALFVILDALATAITEPFKAKAAEIASLP
jgi:hypothetical protein